jgi:hypothetical protein
MNVRVKVQLELDRILNHVTRTGDVAPASVTYVDSNGRVVTDSVKVYGIEDGYLDAKIYGGCELYLHTESIISLTTQV